MRMLIRTISKIVLNFTKIALAQTPWKWVPKIVQHHWVIIVSLEKEDLENKHVDLEILENFENYHSISISSKNFTSLYYHFFKNYSSTDLVNLCFISK